MRGGECVDFREQAGNGSGERGTRKAERGTEARPAGSAFRVPTSALICATKASMSARARSTSSAFFFCLSFTGRSRDRKSTRLNSSHSQISYAVFCLKKKKKNTNVHCCLISE